MDEKLYTIVKEAIPQIDSFNEKMKEYVSFFQGILFLDGKDIISEIIKKENNPSLLAKATEQFISGQGRRVRNVTPSNREQIANCFKSYPNDVLDYFSSFITVVRSIITSADKLIPSNLDEEGKEMARIVKETSIFQLKALACSEIAVQDNLKNVFELKQTKDEIQLPMRFIGAKIISVSLIHSLVGLGFTTIMCMHFHQIVYEYYYGPKNKRGEFAEMAKQIASEIITVLSVQINDIKRGVEQEAKTTAQIKNNTETTNKTLNEVKEKLNVTNELIENRNEEEKPKRLQIAKCAKDICRILENEYKTVVKQKTIEKYLRRFDENLEKGEKIALPSYEHAMYFKKERFISWVRESFIPYYFEHRKIRSKNKTPRRSSSDVAFDEAARQKYEEEEK